MHRPISCAIQAQIELFHALNPFRETSQADHSTSVVLVIVKDLVRVFQDRTNGRDLIRCIGDVWPDVGTHESGSEADCQIAGVHTVVGIMFLDTMKMLFDAD